jgi:hypothetical protein
MVFELVYTAELLGYQEWHSIFVSRNYLTFIAMKRSVLLVSCCGLGRGAFTD